MLVGIGGCILFRLWLDVFLNESGLLGIARRLGIVIRVSARLCLGEELLQFAVGVRGGNIFQDNKVLFFTIVIISCILNDNAKLLHYFKSGLAYLTKMLNVLSLWPYGPLAR